VLHVHLVFVTRYRRGVFDDGMLRFCEEVMRKVCGDFEADLREFNGKPTTCTSSSSTRRRCPCPRS
jgi:REP element-mobilizing transposase RayT